MFNGMVRGILAVTAAMKSGKKTDPLEKDRHGVAHRYSGVSRDRESKRIRAHGKPGGCTPVGYQRTGPVIGRSVTGI
jgi:hypothetical protein